MKKPQLTQQVLYSLAPDSDQLNALNDTVDQYRRATQYVANYACDHQIYNRNDLQRKVYDNLKNDFGLTAQMAINAIMQAVHACRGVIRKQDGAASPVIDDDMPMIYDHRIMSLKGCCGISLRCLHSREVIDSDPLFVLHGFSLNGARSLGQGELFVLDGRYYLALTTDASHRQPERIAEISQDIIGYVEEWPIQSEDVRSTHNLPALYQRVQSQNPQRVLDTLYAESGSIAPKLRWATADPDKMWPSQAETERTDFASSRAASLAK